MCMSKAANNMEDFPYSQWFSLNKSLSSMLPKSIKDRKINMPILHNENSKIFPEREIVRMSGKGRFKKFLQNPLTARMFALLSSEG